MPVRFRGRLWSLCIGNGLAVSKNAYSSALGKAKKALEEGREDVGRVKRDAEEEMERTLPTLKLFQKGGVMHEDLLDLLLAWSVHDPLTPPRYVSTSFEHLNPSDLLLIEIREITASRISLPSEFTTSEHAPFRSLHFPRQPHLEILPEILLLDLSPLTQLVRTSFRHSPRRFHAQSLRKFLFLNGSTLYVPQTLAHHFIRRVLTPRLVDPVIRCFSTRGGFVLF